MFRAKTLFVLGAGASVEVGLPMGDSLLKKIVELTHITYQHYSQKSGDYQISEALKLILNEGASVDKYNDHLKAGWQLGQSAQQALSIDNLIEALEDPKIELMGKLGIVRAIHQAEADSKFFKKPEGSYPDTIDITRFSETWYSSLTKIITENVRKSQIDNIFDNFSVINFNYDRCFEHYLPFALANYYGTTVDTFRALMPTLTIHRPYGVAGKLPWQDGAMPGVAFGGGGPEQLAQVAQQIRTFTEQVEEGDALKAMRDAVSSADRIVFLGFAFHRQNVDLICQKAQSHAEVVGTAYKISPSDQAMIESELETALEFEGMNTQGRIVLANTTCQEFFEQYRKTLTGDPPEWEPIEFRARMDNPFEAMFPQMPRGFPRG